MISPRTSSFLAVDCTVLYTVNHYSLRWIGCWRLYWICQLTFDWYHRFANPLVQTAVHHEDLQFQYFPPRLVFLEPLCRRLRLQQAFGNEWEEEEAVTPSSATVSATTYPHGLRTKLRTHCPEAFHPVQLPWVRFQLRVPESEFDYRRSEWIQESGPVQHLLRPICQFLLPAGFHHHQRSYVALSRREVLVRFEKQSDGEKWWCFPREEYALLNDR